MQYLVSFFLLALIVSCNNIPKQSIHDKEIEEINAIHLESLLNLLPDVRDKQTFNSYVNTSNMLQSIKRLNSEIKNSSPNLSYQYLNDLKVLYADKRKVQYDFVNQLIVDKTIEEISINQYHENISHLSKDNVDGFYSQELLSDNRINALLIKFLCSKRIMPNKFEAQITRMPLPNDYSEFEIRLIGIDEHMAPSLSLGNQRIPLDSQWGFKVKYPNKIFMEEKEITGKLRYLQFAEVKEIPVVLSLEASIK